MNNIIMFCLFFFSSVIAIQAQDCCYPDEDGMYTYYINIKENNIKKSFSKDSLIHILKKSKLSMNKDTKNYEKEIKEAFKSFTNAKTKLLQHSVTNLEPNGNVIVETGSNLTFRATRNIELSPGFEVMYGANFDAEIFQSSCF